MSSCLQGRIACITGASSGLGRAIALAFAKEGASVVCSDLQPQARPAISQESTTTTHDLIVQQGGKARFVKTDVKNEDQVAALIAETVKEYGRLDIMVNNAGISGLELDGISAGTRTHETPIQALDVVMDINVRGVFLGCKYALAQFLVQEPLPPNSRGDRTRGNIINMGSIASLVALSGGAIYTTSKHAVIGLTKQIAADYALDKIHCNAICPGFTETALISSLIQDENESAAATKAAHPWGALGRPEDIARAAVFLASDDASWITGHPLVIDGGYVAK